MKKIIVLLCILMYMPSVFAELQQVQIPFRTEFLPTCKIKLTRTDINNDLKSYDFGSSSSMNDTWYMYYTYNSSTSVCQSESEAIDDTLESINYALTQVGIALNLTKAESADMRDFSDKYADCKGALDRVVYTRDELRNQTGIMSDRLEVCDSKLNSCEAVRDSCTTTKATLDKDYTELKSKSKSTPLMAAVAGLLIGMWLKREKKDIQSEEEYFQNR